MPFKTRRRKVSANERRFSFDKKGTVTYETSHKLVPIIEAAEKVDKRGLKSIEDLSYLKQDLLKILLAASLIIISQIGLSFYPLK